MPEVDERVPGEPARRVLSLDGGGIKGVFIASFLAEIEETCDCRIVDYFDLIAGTSTGGIIALGLGAGLSASEILDFYERWGPRIFKRQRTLLPWVTSSKYSSEPLREALEEVFGDRLLGSSATRLMIPSLNMETGEVHNFKTAHLPRFAKDYREPMVDVALATSAAPTFFPTHRLSSGVPLVDGGMWADNPMGTAAVEAVGVLEWSPKTTRLLSLGCTDQPSTLRDRSKYGLGAAYWGLRVAEMFMMGQSSSSIGTAMHLLDPRNVHRVSPTVDAGRYKLDSVKDIQSLKALGATAARTAAPVLTEQFLTGGCEPFAPFREVKK